MFEIIYQVPVIFGNAIRVWKVIAIDVVNEDRRLCFGGALLSALILEKLRFWKRLIF